MIFSKLSFVIQLSKINQILEKSNHNNVIFCKKINILILNKKNHGRETQKIHESEGNVYFENPIIGKI